MDWSSLKWISWQRYSAQILSVHRIENQYCIGQIKTFHVFSIRRILPLVSMHSSTKEFLISCILLWFLVQFVHVKKMRTQRIFLFHCGFWLHFVLLCIYQSAIQYRRYRVLLAQCLNQHYFKQSTNERHLKTISQFYVPLRPE